MIGLDTNILVRYLTADDESQYRAALKLLCRKGAFFFVADHVLVELDWVLSRVYDWSRDEIADAFARLLQIVDSWEGEAPAEPIFAANAARQEPRPPNL